MKCGLGNTTDFLLAAAGSFDLDVDALLVDPSAIDRKDDILLTSQHSLTPEKFYTLNQFNTNVLQ